VKVRETNAVVVNDVKSPNVFGDETMPFTPPMVPNANQEDPKSPQLKVPKQTLGVPRVALLDPEVAGKIQTLLKKLSMAATNLNAASDALGRAITVWDSVLRKFSLGIEAWVNTTSSGDSGDQWWDRGIGYTQINDKWGLALRERQGSHIIPGVDTDKTWQFNQAPRRLRIEGVAKLPELLEALLTLSEDTTQKLLKETGQMLAMADVARSSDAFTKEEE
jgi:hypothetical protein